MSSQPLEIVPQERELLTYSRFGISFIGAKWSEESLIGFAYAFEQRTQIRSTIKPYIAPTIQLADVVGIEVSFLDCT